MVTEEKCKKNKRNQYDQVNNQYRNSVACNAIRSFFGVVCWGGLPVGLHMLSSVSAGVPTESVLIGPSCKKTHEGDDHERAFQFNLLNSGPTCAIRPNKPHSVPKISRQAEL